MTRWLRRCVLAMLFAAVAAPAQRGSLNGAGRVVDQDTPPLQDDSRLPNGKSQRDEILKAEHAQNLKDAAELADLAKQLQRDLEKNDRFIVSMTTLKKTDDIEKLVRKIRSRLRHN